MNNILSLLNIMLLLLSVQTAKVINTLIFIYYCFKYIYLLIYTIVGPFSYKCTLKHNIYNMQNLCFYCLLQFKLKI